MISKQTTLDLNGPILSFIQQPQSVSVCDSESATFVGIATALFPVQDPPNPASNTGALSYRWYVEGFGPLTDGIFQGTSIAGSGTTTLTITNAKSPLANGLRFYVGVDYVPSAYSQPVGSAVTVGTGRSTGNAVNEVLDSNTASLTVFPVLSVATQPTDQTASQTRTATFTTLGALTDTTQGNISYRWQLNDSDLSDTSTITGTATTTLSIALPNISINTVRARLTHPTACNSPIFTNTVNFNVVAARDIINFESLLDNGTFLSSGSTNLFNSQITFSADPNNAGRSLVIYPPERDIRVRITLAAGAGQSRGARGGEGGLSVFEYIFRQNTEYVFKLGAATAPTGGANGGGGAAFLYEKARLIAVCGGGGGSGTSGRGGDGGGIGVGGEFGSGRNSGAGGARVADGQLPTATGFFPGGETIPPPSRTATTGGQASGCTIGDHYRLLGFSPCQDVGQRQWTGTRGTVASQTAVIQRGYKAGLAYRNNGGNGSGNQGGAGSGAYGGNAATSDGSGGGGGSGYTDGSIILLSTRLGGNSSTNAFATIESLS
jgi:hypothetical protein